MCAPRGHGTHRTSLVVKKNFFNFPVAVKNSIKVVPLVFLLQIFVITDNIMKRPVLFTRTCFVTNVRTAPFFEED